MKYPAHTYAKALSEVVADPKTDSASAVKNFLALVQRNGDESHLPKIIEAADRLVRKKIGMRKITVTSARKLSKSAKAFLGDFAHEKDIIEERIRPDLIAGMTIAIDDEEEFDGSLKGKLESMFGNI